MADSLKKASIRGFAWRTIQNVSTQAMSFIIQIILARILLPSDYGIIGLTSVFITILNVVVTTGFSSAIVQKKEISETDLSSMFFLSLLTGIILYVVVFFSAEPISNFYENSLLKSVLRVQGVSLIVASIISVHNAIIARKLDFKKSFFAGIIAVSFQGITGIALALKGFGVWALVYSTLVSNVVNCLVILLVCRWIPKKKPSFISLKVMVSFSSKILAGNLLNTIYNSFKTLVIGKVYDSDMVGYYNKGFQFPSIMMSGIDGAMTTTLFSTLSKLQDDKERFIQYLRKGIKLSLTVVVPLLCGMAAVADPMIRLLLTDKWIEAAPFVMITCLICLTWPLSAKTQALNSIGKSGINLVINILVKVIGIILIFLSIPFGVYVMCITSFFASIIGVVIESIVISKYFNYSLKQQFFDVVPIYLIGLIMFAIVYGLSLILYTNLFLKLFILVIAGVAIYFGLSSLFRLDGFLYIVGMIKTKFKRKEDNIDD